VLFCKKAKNGFFVKSGKWGMFFCKKVDLSWTQSASCTASVCFILHFTYLGGCVRTQRIPSPLPTCWCLLIPRRRCCFSESRDSVRVCGDLCRSRSHRRALVSRRWAARLRLWAAPIQTTWSTTWLAVGRLRWQRRLRIPVRTGR